MALSALALSALPAVTPPPLPWSSVLLVVVEPVLTLERVGVSVLTRLLLVCGQQSIGNILLALARHLHWQRRVVATWRGLPQVRRLECSSG